MIGGVAGGVPDAVTHGKTGLLVDGTSVDAIAAACIRLLQGTTLRNEMGANGLMHARENDWQMITQKFLAYCEKILRR